MNFINEIRFHEIFPPHPISLSLSMHKPLVLVLSTLQQQQQVLKQLQQLQLLQ